MIAGALLLGVLDLFLLGLLLVSWKRSKPRDDGTPVPFPARAAAFLALGVLSFAGFAWLWSPPTWTDVVSSEGGFTVSFPKGFALEERPATTTAGTVVSHAMTYGSRLRHESYAAGYADYPDKVFANDGVPAMLDRIRALHEKTAALKSKKDLTLGGAQGQELRLVLPSGDLRCILTVIRRPRAFMLTAEVPPWAAGDVDAFFASFKLSAP
jgi:hypothetical protein